MTQLSPLLWILLTPIITLTTIMFMSNTWWAQLPSFKEMKSPSSSKLFKKWSW